jgi:catechol 2,3-dioxygenase-like lactoylglutathione lyase family enzyme
METNKATAPQTTTLLQGIDTIIVRVSNVEASKAWYAQKLGLHPVWEAPEMGLVVLDTGGPTSLTLWQTNNKIADAADTASYPIFRTPNATDLHAELKARGVSTGELTQDAYVLSFFFYDPDGNRLEACQVHIPSP